MRVFELGDCKGEQRRKYSNGTKVFADGFFSGL
jgi:hypothetical protein